MTWQLADSLSFRRVADIPFDTYMAALEGWQLTRHDGELRLGHSLLRGPIRRDPHHPGTWRIEVRLARGPLRPPVRMRLNIEPWSPTATALELIPCQRVRPSAAYFAAGHRLLDSLTRPLAARVPAQRPDQDHRRAAVTASAPALSRS
jgi:hypothetical protein